MKEENVINEFEILLNKSIKESVKDNQIGLAFSGGLDSSVLAKLLKSNNNQMTAYVVGIENSKDFESAEKAAKEIGINLKKILVTSKEIEEAMKIVKNILNETYENHKNEPDSNLLKPNILSISFYLPLFFVAEYSKEKTIITGQGADELLGGYYRYLKMSKKFAIKEMNKDAQNLLKIGKLRDCEITKHFNKNLLMPYLNNEISDFCISLPHELKIKNKQRKYILRKLGEKIGLSKDISYKEKRAAQYGSGIMKAIKKIEKVKNQKLGLLL